MEEINRGFEVYDYKAVSESEVVDRSKRIFNELNKRRSIRHFSDRDVPREVIENLLKSAGTAPSGAHKQPWHFAAIRNAELKSKIRNAAEKEEYLNYTSRMNEQWIKDLAVFGTDWNKGYIDVVPWLIAVFKKPYDVLNGEKQNNYYVNESVGIACGMLISAIHQVGLVTLTHTPSPMNFLQNILERPANERAFLLLPVGYPAHGAKVPIIDRKSLEEISSFH